MENELECLGVITGIREVHDVHLAEKFLKNTFEYGNIHNLQLIQRIRMEREDKKSYAQLERKRRELFKIRLDSDDLIRRHTIIHRVRHKERINHQKQLLKKQRRVKEHVKKVSRTF